MIIQTAPKASRTTLVQRAQAILQHRYRLRPGQKALVVYDGPKERVGKVFAQAARRIGAKVDVFRLRRNRFSDQTKKSLAEKTRTGNYDVFVNIIEGGVEEAEDRWNLVKNQMVAQKDNGGAIIHAPSIEESMLQIEINYNKLIDTTKKLLKALNKAIKVEVQTSLGTNLQIDIEERIFLDDVIPKKNDWGNYPCGEVYCAPIEHAANGTMIADGSAGNFGVLPQPLKFKLKDGKISSLAWLHRPSANTTLLSRIRETLFQDNGASVIGELGIGLAPYLICGNMLQDEKVAGTIHIAFGANDFFGGKNKSKSHVDFLIRNPQLTVSYIDDKPPRILTREGKLLA